MKESKSTTIKLLGKDYQVACPAGKEKSLLEASEHLNEHMARINNNRNLLRIDKIVIQAALNMANELLEYKQEQEAAYADLYGKLGNLQNKLDNVLTKTRRPGQVEETTDIIVRSDLA